LLKVEAFKLAAIFVIKQIKWQCARLPVSVQLVILLSR